jgi:hypothetical protein
VEYHWVEPDTVRGRLDIVVRLRGLSDRVEIEYRFQNVGAAPRKADISSCFQSSTRPAFAITKGQEP